jgi:elongation factor Ts
MKTVTSEMVKELRERTGVGMVRCKEALDACHGDIEKSIDYLRKAGIASAGKKEGREAKEGAIGIGESSQVVALVEVNTETDFVAQNEAFKEFLLQIANDAAKKRPESVEALLKMAYKEDASTTIDEKRAMLIQKLGENIQVRRLHLTPKRANVSVGHYHHMGGKIAAVVAIAGEGEEALARDIAMHVAAEAPDYIRPEEVPAEVVQREREIAQSQIGNKPAAIAEKIIEGKLQAFYAQSCLLHQKYVRDSSVTISALLAQRGKKEVLSFIRWKVGS